MIHEYSILLCMSWYYNNAFCFEVCTDLYTIGGRTCIRRGALCATPHNNRSAKEETVTPARTSQTNIGFGPGSWATERTTKLGTRKWGRNPPNAGCQFPRILQSHLPPVPMADSSVPPSHSMRPDRLWGSVSPLGLMVVRSASFSLLFVILFCFRALGRVIGTVLHSSSEMRNKWQRTEDSAAVSLQSATEQSEGTNTQPRVAAPRAP